MKQKFAFQYFCVNHITLKILDHCEVRHPYVDYWLFWQHIILKTVIGNNLIKADVCWFFTVKLNLEFYMYSIMLKFISFLSYMKPSSNSLTQRHPWNCMLELPLMLLIFIVEFNGSDYLRSLTAQAGLFCCLATSQQKTSIKRTLCTLTFIHFLSHKEEDFTSGLASEQNGLVSNM